MLVVKTVTFLRGAGKMKVKMAFLMCVVCFSLAGCQSLKGLVGFARDLTPEQEYATAVIAYAYVVETAIDLHDTGRITDEQFLTFNEYRGHVDRALRVWEQALEAGISVESAKEIYRSAMARLTEKTEVKDNGD